MVKKFRRTVTNVGEGITTYKVFVTSPPCSEVEVLPRILMFATKYEKNLIE